MSIIGSGGIINFSFGTGVESALAANANGTGGIVTVSGLAGGTLPASFTTIGASGVVTITNATGSTTSTTGALVVTGGGGFGGRIVSGNDVFCGTGNALAIIGRSGMRSSADGEIQFRNSANSTNSNITAANITASGGVVYGSFTVGTFPTTERFMAVVTDALAPVAGAAAAAGGSARALVMYSGTTKTVISPLP